METDQIMSAIFLIAVLILILPGFLSTNSKLKQFLRNLSIWTIIVILINLAISGCMGRMGQQLIRSAKKDKTFKIVSLTENRIIRKKIFGINPELNSENAFSKAQVIIDFTVPECTLQILKIAIKQKKKL